jgi:DNA-binding transcriptional LysR family regulator
VGAITQYRQDVGMLLHAVDDPDVHCVPYRRQPLVVFAARGHPLAHRGVIDISALDGQEFVLREEGSQTRSVFEAGMRAAGVRIRSSVEIGSRESVREAVAQGLGLGVVAQTAFIPDVRLVALEIKGLNLATHAHLICMADRKSEALIQEFLKLALQVRPAQ